MIKKTKLVVLTGAGMSAESGIATFRGSDGLWQGHRVEEVASPEAWRRNPSMVLDFYNQRRRKAAAAQPNAGHHILADLEQHFATTIVTQNVDTLHERAGSSHIIHLHGVISQSRSTREPNRVYEIDGTELNLGDLCELGSQLRPNIVWFGEPVPLIDTAAEIVAQADVFVVVGTSLQVYPAAGLINVPADSVPKFIIDPSVPTSCGVPNLTVIEDVASRGLARLRELLVRVT